MDIEDVPPDPINEKAGILFSGRVSAGYPIGFAKRQVEIMKKEIKKMEILKKLLEGFGVERLGWLFILDSNGLRMSEL